MSLIIERKMARPRSVAKTEYGLNLQQEEFCKFYTNSEAVDRELFGNGVQCYLEVYGEEYRLRYKRQMKYETALALASRLLTNVKVIDRVNVLLEEGGFNDQNVDKQHLFLINQHADLKTKLGAIREYNSLKSRIKQSEGDKTLIVVISGETARRYDVQPTQLAKDNSAR